jgi:hypothetical protein
MPPELKALFESISTSLNNLTDPSQPDYLGEPWRSQLLEVKGQINASLQGLPETDKVPAAQEAGYGLACLKATLLSVQSIVNSLTDMAKRTGETKAQANASLETGIETAVQSKITAGELITKNDATELASQARKEGEQAGFDRGRVLGDRRSALALAGIPVEVAQACPESTLSAEAAVFEAAKSEAKDRFEKLSGVGLTVASAAAVTLPWASKESFDASLETFAAIKQAATPVTQSNNSVQRAGKPNGLIGGSASPAVSGVAPFLC